ncbi:MAG: hypothetical protein P8J87_13290, partial [Verrucomicrobiales bacterium]|nr:hypothetical protein [Verrucomicrobiales bacterium]
MNSTLLKLLGADGSLQADAVGELSLRLAAPSSTTLVVVFGALFTIAAWLLYRRSPQDVRPARRWILTVLRATFLILLTLLLLR